MKAEHWISHLDPGFLPLLVDARGKFQLYGLPDEILEMEAFVHSLEKGNVKAANEALGKLITLVRSRIRKDSDTSPDRWWEYRLPSKAVKKLGTVGPRRKTLSGIITSAAPLVTVPNFFTTDLIRTCLIRPNPV